MIEDCTAIIMAGGDSRRMGSDKADLMLGEQTLLMRVIAVMRQVFPTIIVSVRQLRPGIDLPQVCDGQIDAGPLAGFAACLEHVSTPWAFVIACDMPFVEPEVVELLARFRSGYQAVVPVVNGHPQPLAAYYAISCLPELRENLSTQDTSLRGLLQRLEVNYVNHSELQIADPRMSSFFDLDTPQDVDAALLGVK